jgi:enoyl-CoA hydratase/carnithine racemase
MTAPTSSHADIRVLTEGGVATITLNRIARKNALTADMYAALADVFKQAQDSAEVRVVVIQGDEAVFCAGNDITDFLQNPPNNEQSPVFAFLLTLATFPKPLVASVCGPAVGIGTTLLFHCDLVYAGDNAAFSMPFVNLGLCAEGASSLLAPQMFGYHRAAEALLLGEPFYAEAALEVGLVNKVLPPSETAGYTQNVARKLAAKPLSSLLATKRLMKQAQQPAVLQAIRDEGAAFGRMLGEPAAKEAFAAFMEKRQPNFANT